MKSLYCSIIVILAGCGACNSDNKTQNPNQPKPNQTDKKEPLEKSIKGSSADLKNEPLPIYEWLNDNVFSTRCVACHNAENSKANVDLSTYESILDSPRFPKLIEPLLPNGSLVFRVIEANSMPPGENKLNESERLALKKWIETGARKSENDPVPTPIPTPTEPPD